MSKPHVEYAFITVTKNAVVFRIDCEEHKDFAVECNSPEELNGMLNDFEFDNETICMCSSTVDFPEEVTREKWIIDYCRSMRSGESQECTPQTDLLAQGTQREKIMEQSRKNALKHLVSLNRYTANQDMILRIAYNKGGGWVTTAGMCNAGGFTGRGLHFSLARLEKDGWIEVRDSSVGIKGIKRGYTQSHRHSFRASEELIRHIEA